MSERVYCSEVAKALPAQLAGTAVHVDMWLLIEYPRPWKAKALQDNDLEERVNTHLAKLTAQATSAGLQFRIQFIKQASSTERARPHIFLIDGRGQPRQLQGRFGSYSDLLALSSEDLFSFNLPEAFAAGSSAASLLLVCTNGQRDLCCARFGLPLFEALRIEFDRRVWQTTHVGGHRYAPNLLCLPSGLLYGFVEPEGSVALVDEHDQGELRLSQLRGRSCYTARLQAAEISLLEQNIGDANVGFELKEEGDWVRFQHPDGRNGRVWLEHVELPPAVASCGKQPKADFAYRCTNIEINE